MGKAELVFTVLIAFISSALSLLPCIAGVLKAIKIKI